MYETSDETAAGSQRSSLSIDEVIRKKYLQDGVNRCGYVGGILLANQLGLTTQVPDLFDVFTNKG